MQNQLWSVRLKSFAISASTILGAGLLTSLISPEFLKLVETSTNGTFWGTLAVIVLPEIAKHIRNKIVVGKAIKKYGAVVSSAEAGVVLI